MFLFLPSQLQLLLDFLKYFFKTKWLKIWHFFNVYGRRVDNFPRAAPDLFLICGHVNTAIRTIPSVKSARPIHSLRLSFSLNTTSEKSTVMSMLSLSIGTTKGRNRTSSGPKQILRAEAKRRLGRLPALLQDFKYLAAVLQYREYLIVYSVAF